jgi:spermidine synthase
VLLNRGDNFLITIAGRVLMSSLNRRSEEALATLACAPIAVRRAPAVLIGGLGMACTVRAALDALPADARVTVAELTPTVVDWCRGPLAPLTGAAVADPRVRVVIGDVADAIASGVRYDAILLDLYEGPHGATQRHDDPFYGRAALARAHAALTPGGALAVWSEEPDAAFPNRLTAAGFDVSVHRPGRGGRTHVVYLGLRR